MNKPSALRTVIVSVILFTVMNILASCDSCNRKDNNETATGTNETGDSATMDDTLNNDHASGNADTGFDTPASNNRGTGTGRATTSTGSSTGNRNETANGDNSTGYGDSNSPIENSSTPATKNGRLVESGGTAGSGIGTGTGSTGNNSKVTRPEDQRN